jgi:hypothetical protein
MDSSLFALLSRDAGQLLKPLMVTSLAGGDKENIQADSHPNAVLMLSDIASLFNPPAYNHPRKAKAIFQKLVFYAGQIVSTPAPILTAVVDELTVSALGHERNGETRNGHVTENLHPRNNVKAPPIEEL